MKIIFTIHQFLPDFSTGTEILTLSVAKEFKRRGHNVLVFSGFPASRCHTNHDVLDEYEYQGIPVRRFRHAYVKMGDRDSLVEMNYDNRMAAACFQNVLESFLPDVVLFFHLSRLGTGLIDVTLEKKIPGYFVATDFWTICQTAQLLLPNMTMCRGPSCKGGNCVKHYAQITQSGIARTIADWMPTCFFDVLAKVASSGLLDFCSNSVEIKAFSARLRKNISRVNKLNKVIVPNGMMQAIMLEHGINSNKIQVIGYGIESLPFFRREPHNPFCIGYIGTLSEPKGCHVLIEAFMRLPRKSAILKIYGSTEDFPMYSRELMAQASIYEGVEFLGSFEHSSMSEVFAGLDVLVVPSVWHENTPLVVYEAISARCPLVASNIRGISEVIEHGSNGLLFEAGNAIELSSQLLRLINDSDLLSRIARNTKQPKTVCEYVDELLRLLKEAME